MLIYGGPLAAGAVLSEKLCTKSGKHRPLPRPPSRGDAGRSQKVRCSDLINRFAVRGLTSDWVCMHRLVCRTAKKSGHWHSAVHIGHSRSARVRHTRIMHMIPCDVSTSPAGLMTIPGKAGRNEGRVDAAKPAEPDR